MSFTKSSLEEILGKLKESVCELQKVIEIPDGCGDKVTVMIKNVSCTIIEQVKLLSYEMKDKSTANAGVQTLAEDIDLNMTVGSLRRDIGRDMSFEIVEKLVDKEWPEEAFFKVDTKVESIASLDIEGQVAIMASPEGFKGIKFLRTLLGTSRRTQQYLKSGEMSSGEIITHSSEISSKINGEEITDKTEVYLVGLDQGQKSKQVSRENLWDMSHKLRERIGEDREWALHIAIIDGLSIEDKRKILECAFVDWAGKVYLHEKSATSTNRRNREYGSEAIMIEKPEYRTYAEMVTSLKRNLKEEKNLVDDIERVRKTRDGHLLVEVKKGSNLAPEILQKIKVNAVGPVRRLTGSANRWAANIYGIDIDVKKEEVEMAIKNALGKSTTDLDFEIKALRPMMGGRQAATVIASEGSIKELLSRGSIKIGLSRADIRERRDIIKCLRCWEEGHIAKECQGEDRRNKCRNCCKEGHQVRECKDEPFCAICGTVGHRTATRVCMTKKQKK